MLMLTCILLTHNCVMARILVLLAPGALSEFSDASCESTSLMMLGAMMNDLSHEPIRCLGA